MTWLISQALMNSLCLQGQEEASLGGNFSDGEQSAPLNGNPIQQAYCAPDKMTVFSRLSRFGMTFKPLTESRGQELLTSYLAVFPVKTSQQQEKAQELTESDQECGEKWRASFVKYDPDSSLWRTHQCSLLGDLEEFSETWPQWGLMRDGECWEQRMLEQTIRGTESGLSEKLPTPQASDHITKKTSASWKAKGGVNFSLANPEIQAKWPTPDANCGQRGTQPNWTPKRKSGQPAQYTINQAVRDRMFPTPTAHNAKECNSPSEKNRNTPTLATHAGGKLNPDWVEWLMNWPIKWSNINEFNAKEYERWQEASATAIQKPLQMRTMWWDRDPSQTSHRSRYEQQQEQQHSDSLHQMPRVTSCESEVERSYEGQDLSLLRDSVYIQETKRKDLQSGVWEQTCMDETQIVPRVSQSTIAHVDRLKAIGNGQVPLCAATAWRILAGD